MARGCGDLRSSVVLIRISIVIGVVLVVLGEFQPLVTLFDVSFFGVNCTLHCAIDCIFMQLISLSKVFMGYFPFSF